MRRLREFNGNKAAFAFRIDLDFFHPRHVEETLRVAERHGIKMTWFVNMQTGQFHEREIKRIAKTQDVQNHGFLHETFGDKEANLENVLKGHELLGGMDVKCNSFAAPFGYWNQALGKALEETGYEYSSEFREGKNVFPFYPKLAGKKAKVLQMPIHPICLGNLFESGYNEEEAIEYFDRIIGLLYEKRLPIFLYGHPTGRLGAYPQVLDSIFKIAKQLDGIWFTSLTDYAKFWREKNFRERKTEWHKHNAFFENKPGKARRIKQFYKGQLLRVEKKKIDRRLHR